MRTVRLLCFFFCLFLSVSCSAWAEDTGHLRLQIQAPPDFNSSIMINLIRDDMNTLLVAEPINHYNITQDVPAGTYQVDFVAADPYTFTYPKTVTIQVGQTAEMPLQINAPMPQQTAAATPTSAAATYPAAKTLDMSKTDPKPSKIKSGQKLAWALVRQCGASCLLLLAGGIGYILIKKRKEE